MERENEGGTGQGWGVGRVTEKGECAEERWSVLKKARLVRSVDVASIRRGDRTQCRVRSGAHLVLACVEVCGCCMRGVEEEDEWK